MCFWGSKGPGTTVIVVLEHAFKAKMVTFWEVSRLFTENALFAQKTVFLRNFTFLRGILLFW